MRIYFSGGRGLKNVPEALAHEVHPHIMLTFHTIGTDDTIDRLNVYLERKYTILKSKSRDIVPPSTKSDRPLYTESIFMDSGAYSLYGLHVGDRKSKVGKNGNVLDRVLRRRFGYGDYSYYSLKPGSEFRGYCDRYAAFMRALGHTDVLFTTVDAIQKPSISWDVQKYFEKEHGLRPVPVVHGGTPDGVRWLVRYMESGYKMVGFGGLGHSMRVPSYKKWADELWRVVCPASNNHRPVVRVHGFAMTGWNLMYEWPWWSVDSATWVKNAAYGWILVPRWKDGVFLYDKPPFQINISRTPQTGEKKFWWRVRFKTPRKIKDRHYDSASPYLQECVDRWLEHLGIEMGQIVGTPVKTNLGVNKDLSVEDYEVTDKGVTSDFRLRAVANLKYFSEFQNSITPWEKIQLHTGLVKEKLNANFRQGLGVKNYENRKTKVSG